MSLRNLFYILFFFKFLFIISSINANELNIYSARHYNTDMNLYRNFEEKTGIKINLIEGKADGLIERIKSEEELTPADILITVDAGRLWRAKELNLFQEVKSEILDNRVPKHLRDPEGHWFGLSLRARVIVVNKNINIPVDIKDYSDLANPLLKNSICMRPSNNIYNLSLMSSLINYMDEDAAKAWATSVVNNFSRQPQGNDTAQIKAVARGVCSVTIANTYYIARLMNSNIMENKELYKRIKVIFPNQNNRGTHINISGAGITKYSKNYKNAVMFLEYMTTKFAQSLFSEGNNEYVVYGNGKGPIYLLGEFKKDKLDSYILGKNQAMAMRLFDKAGWK